MTPLASVILGFVQGITEFLPISSTGHLILVREALTIAGENALAIDAILHLATALAVLVYFRTDIWRLIHVLLRYVGRLPTERRDLALAFALIVGTVPAAFGGVLLEGLMETLFRSPLLVAGVLVAGSALFALAEHSYAKTTRTRDISVRMGFLIGCFQTLALIPGMSRSGAAISGGMLLGLSREEAARFAFLLAIPVLLGAGGKKLLELLGAGGEVAWVSVGLGALVAFLVGLAAIHFMLGFVRRHTLWPFIWYRLALAAVVVVVVLGA